ncbi:6-carboxytetrahydropterin synthase [Alistipes sp. OttesenSCG-928-L06]|nr:6-carboxytetrahydropterin synthase [Alistipes sp. OttesenSCG-928-L06]
MAKIRLTKEFTFEMSHALEGYDGACKQAHGHSYRLFVTVAGTPDDDPQSPKYGMVMDFGDLKRIVRRTVVDRCDHAFIIRRTEANAVLIEAMRVHFGKVEAVDYQPTCENMIARFADTIRAELPDGITLHSLRLHETATSFAEWFAEDNGL